MTQQNPSQRIYLDNAATTWPKLSRAVEAAVEFITQCGATSGRGAYGSAVVADRWLQDARTKLAQLIGAPSGTSIAICNSGTHALNAALRGVLSVGDHVITTAAEHNSLLRPLEAMRKELSLTIDVVPADRMGRSHAEDAKALIREETRLLAIGHASNVTGAVTDLNPWSELARQSSAKLLVDASQSIGYVDVNVATTRIDILASAGHKGLRALPGSGFLFVAPHLQQAFRPLMYGGTGRSSESLTGGSEWPHCVEVGNLNLPAIVSMAVCAHHIVETPATLSQWQPAFSMLYEGLREMDAIEIIGWAPGGNSSEVTSGRIPVLSILCNGWSPHDMASVLDDAFKIETRAGWHCAAAIHSALGTDADGGTLRLSPGHSTTLDEIERTIEAFSQILRGT